MFKKKLIIFIFIISIFSFYDVNAEVIVWESRFWDEYSEKEIYGREYVPNENIDDFTNPSNRNIWSSSIKNSLLGTSQNNVVDSSSENWLTSLQSIIVWIKDTLTGFLLLIAIGVFLYIWIRIVFARWNPEEFKKAWVHLIYAIIWIFIISIAWATVTLISGLSI